MAAKVFFLLATIAAVAYASDSDCNCEPLSDNEDSALWDFFKKIASYPDAQDSNNERLDAVLPGELSPLLDCNCLEKTRRKRKTAPEVVETTPEGDYSDQSYDDLTRTPKCAYGYVLWYGRCINEKIVMEK